MLAIWPYVRTMKHFPVFLMVCVASIGAWAQPLGGREKVPAAPAHEQRRAELRSALKAPNAREAQAKNPPPKNAPANRHLSAQERADLRQQLRLQRGETRSDRS